MTTSPTRETNEIFFSFPSDIGNNILSLPRSTLFAMLAAGTGYVEPASARQRGPHGVCVRALSSVTFSFVSAIHSILEREPTNHAEVRLC